MLVAGDRWVKSHTPAVADTLAVAVDSWAMRYILAWASFRVVGGSSVMAYSWATGMSVGPGCMEVVSRWRDPVDSAGRVRTVAGCSKVRLLTAAASSLPLHPHRSAPGSRTHG